MTSNRADLVNLLMPAIEKIFSDVYDEYGTELAVSQHIIEVDFENANIRNDDDVK